MDFTDDFGRDERRGWRSPTPASSAAGRLGDDRAHGLYQPLDVRLSGVRREADPDRPTELADPQRPGELPGVGVTAPHTDVPLPQAGRHLARREVVHREADGPRSPGGRPHHPDTRYALD